MKIPLLRPKLPSLADCQTYYKLAEIQGQYSNFGVVYGVACDKLKRIYPGSNPVLVNNGTTAIQAALQTVFKRGSRIAVPSYTFIATLNAVTSAGMIPVLFDCDDSKIDKGLLIANHNEYDGIIVVSPFGHAVSIPDYDNIAEVLGKKIVYDFAAAWGHKISSKHPTTFSFHATKNMPIGEGGAILFPYSFDADAAKQLINFDLNNSRYSDSMHGVNGKLDELHCAMLCAQLDRNNEILADIKVIRILVDAVRSTTNLMFRSNGHYQESFPQLPVFYVGHDEPIIKFLAANGIETKKYYYPRLNEMFPDLPYFTSGEVVSISHLALPRTTSILEQAHILKVLEDGRARKWKV